MSSEQFNSPLADLLRANIKDQNERFIALAAQIESISTRLNSFEKSIEGSIERSVQSSIDSALGQVSNKLVKLERQMAQIDRTDIGRPFTEGVYSSKPMLRSMRNTEETTSNPPQRSLSVYD